MPPDPTGIHAPTIVPTRLGIIFASLLGEPVRNEGPPEAGEGDGECGKSGVESGASAGVLATVPPEKSEGNGDGRCLAWPPGTERSGGREPRRAGELRVCPTAGVAWAPRPLGLAVPTQPPSQRLGLRQGPGRLGGLPHPRLCPQCSPPARQPDQQSRGPKLLGPGDGAGTTQGAVRASPPKAQRVPRPAPGEWAIWTIGQKPKEPNCPNRRSQTDWPEIQIVFEAPQITCPLSQTPPTQGSVCLDWVGALGASSEAPLCPPVSSSLWVIAIPTRAPSDLRALVVALHRVSSPSPPSYLQRDPLLGLYAII
eukprot:XP_028334575.1 uncharacterized protein LOC114484197 [Physeter catodon]